MRIRHLALAVVLALPQLAAAQVFVVTPPAPPRVYVGPPGYAVPPPPPHVYIRERIRWHLRRAVAAPPAVVVAPPPPPPVYVQPPQVYVAPPPPVYYAPPPPPPVYYAPAPPPVYYSYPPAPAPVVLVRPLQRPPGWTSKIGLGVRGSGFVARDTWHNAGIGGEFLARLSNHVSLELAAEYQKATAAPTGAERIDVPATIGFRFHIGKPHWVVSPYFVAALGVNYAKIDLLHVVDEAIFFDGQLGGGLELRLGQHVAITADVRFDGKKRLDKASPQVASLESVNGFTIRPVKDEYGAQFRLGFAVYF